MPHAAFTHGEVTVRVECDDRAVLQWLEEFLTPWLIVDAARAPDVTVALRRDPSAYAALLARGPRPGGGMAGGFAFDSGLVELPWWSAPDDGLVAFEEAAALFYCRDAAATRVELLIAAEQLDHRVCLLRAVREYFVSHAWRADAAVVHGAALSVGDGGIAIAGAKHAGKTTLLIQLLRGARTALVANDRIVVSSAGDALTVRGIPTVVQVRRPPADRLPALHALLTGAEADHRLSLAQCGPRDRPPRRGNPPLVISPAQFAALLEIPLAAATRLDTLLFPRVEPRAAGLVLAPLAADDAAARLRACVWGGADPRLSELFVLPGRAPALDVAALDAWCAATVRRLRAFECRLGHDADRPEEAQQVIAAALV